MQTAVATPKPTMPALDFADMQRFPRQRTINSDVVQLYPLLLNGKQIKLDKANGLVWWTMDPRSATGKRVIEEVMEVDQAINAAGGGEQPLLDANQNAVTRFNDVYMRADRSHMHNMPRWRNSDNQSVSNLISKGGNSMPEDNLLKKGFHFCTPEEYVAHRVQSEMNAQIAAEDKLKRDPKMATERLTATIKEAMATYARAGNVRDALAQAEEDDRKAAEATIQKPATKGK